MLKKKAIQHFRSKTEFTKLWCMHPQGCVSTLQAMHKVNSVMAVWYNKGHCSTDHKVAFIQSLSVTAVQNQGEEEVAAATVILS